MVDNVNDFSLHLNGTEYPMSYILFAYDVASVCGESHKIGGIKILRSACSYMSLGVLGGLREAKTIYEFVLANHETIKAIRNAQFLDTAEPDKRNPNPPF